MQKKLIALAVAGMFAAPAFAATSNVDVYGKLHMSVSNYDDQAAGADLQFSSNASRIGFKGAEDLGGGLSAIWQIEQTVGLDETGTSGGFASRNSFLGLKGGFGTALIGRHDTPLKSVGRKVDLFGDTVADSRGVMGLVSDTRPNNTVAYVSPSFSGLQVSAAYTNSSNNNTNPDTADNSLWSASVTYDNGPLFLGLGYSDGEQFDAAGIDREYSLAAGFTMGDFKVVGQYVANDNVAADYDAWMLGGAYTMGNIVLKANYMEGEVDGSTIDIKQWTVGADYKLSKRTSLYALYADGENVGFGYGVGSSDRVAPAVEDLSVLSIGMIHTF